VFALIDPNGDPYAGTRNELTPIVKNWVQDVDPPLLRMNFARFCGEEALAERSAAEAVKLKTSEFKNQEQAVRWFIDAVIIAELFNTLAETYVPQQEKARDRLFENALVSVRFNKGRLVIELPSALLDGKARLSKNRSFRLGKVLELARVATGRDLDLTAAATPRAAKTFDVTTQIRVDNVAAEINKLSRQEQRLSVLIRTILDDPPAGELLLSQYSDSAKFASNSARLLRGVLENAEDYSNLELQIAKVIPTLLTRAFPRQRGRLLVELAHGMSRHRRIASVIRGIVLKSRSNEIQSVREVVLKNLAE
jgi:hypothetical protein